jgi:hypothetical protein
MRFEVATAVLLRIHDAWDVTMSSWVYLDVSEKSGIITLEALNS